MNLSRRFLGPLLALGVITVVTACASPEEASGPLQTVEPVGPRDYATIPPISEPATTAPPAQPQPGEVTTIEVVHTVEPNESVSLIAAKYQISAEAVAELNGFESINQLLLPGERLRIPVGATMPGGTESATETPAAAAESSSGDNAAADAGESSDANADTAAEQDDDKAGTGCTYEIKSGDNPTKVATKVGITVEQLRAANSEAVMGSFLIGQKLVIPAPGNC